MKSKSKFRIGAKNKLNAVLALCVNRAWLGNRQRISIACCYCIIFGTHVHPASSNALRSPFPLLGPTMRRLIYVIKSAPPSLIFASARCKVGKSMRWQCRHLNIQKNHRQSMSIGPSPSRSWSRSSRARSRSSRSDAIQAAIDRTTRLLPAAG